MDLQAEGAVVDLRDAQLGEFHDLLVEARLVGRPAHREQGGLGEISFPLAADTTLQVSRDYGVLVEEEGIALRGLFIIDPEGVLRYSVVHDLNVGRSVDETLRVLEALQAGGLCPANWKPGQKTLGH